MARNTRNTGSLAPKRRKNSEVSPAAGAIARIRAATEKAHRAESTAQAIREKVRSRLERRGDLPSSAPRNLG